MADIPESEILDLIKARVETGAVEPLFEAALKSAGISRKPLYSAEEVVDLGAAITEASYNLLQQALAQQGQIPAKKPLK